MSADQLERAFGLLTAATEAGQIGAASLTVARHGKEVFTQGMRTTAPSHGPAGRCEFNISPRLNHQAGYGLCADDPRRSRSDLTRRPGHQLSPRIHRWGPPRRQSAPFALAHIRHARHASRKHQLATGAHARGWLRRAGTSDTLALQTRDRFLLPEHGHPARSRNSRTSQRAAIARLRARGDLRTVGNGAKRIGNGRLVTSGRSVVRNGRRRGRRTTELGLELPVLARLWGTVGRHAQHRARSGDPLANHAQRRHLWQSAHLQPRRCRHNDTRSKRGTQCALGNRLGRIRSKGMGLLGRPGIAAILWTHRSDRHGGLGRCRTSSQLRRAHQPDGRRR